jgi:hypothetical protein
MARYAMIRYNCNHCYTIGRSSILLQLVCGMSETGEHNQKKRRHGRKKFTPDPVVPAAIGEQLRHVYDHVVNEPIPDRFKKLLEQLSRSEENG